MRIENANLYCPDHTFRMGYLETNGRFITKIHYDNDSASFENKKTKTTSQVFDSVDSERVDAHGGYLIPGLIDIHLHGCMGVDACDGSAEALNTMANYQLSQGITGFTPATMTLPFQELEHIFQTIGEYCGKAPSYGARLLGIHMEGPYFSEKKKGAQNAAYLQLPDITKFQHLQELSGGHITQVDIAPELPGAISFIQEISQDVQTKNKTGNALSSLSEPITVSLGHTAADYDTAIAGFSAGASHVTHLFNGMMPFSHREPGLVGAAADTSNVRVEMICDGIHLHPTTVRAMFRLFGPERILLISDSMRATGMPNGTYTLGGQNVHVQNGLATLIDGTIAGSATNLMECVRRTVSMGIPLEQVIRCASENQAKELGIFHQTGSLEAGKLADMVLLDTTLALKAVWLEGIR